MRILFTTSLLITGGIQTLMLRLAKNTHLDGDIKFIFLFFSKNVDIEFLKELKRYSEVYFLDDYLYLPKSFKGLPIILKFLFPIKKQKLDLLLKDVNHIHASNINSILFANKFLKSNRNITYSIGVYSLNEYVLNNYKKTYFGKTLYNLINNFSANNFMFFNEISREEYSKIYSNNLMKSIVSPIGVDLEQFSNCKLGVKNNRIVSIGRLAKWKTYNFHIIDVIKKFKDENIYISYDCYGEGSEYKTLEKKILDFKLEDRIKFHPTIPYAQFKEKISNSLLFIGAGTALIEASACGIPSLIGIENEEKSNPLTFGFLHNLKTLSYQEIELNLDKIRIYDCIQNLYNLSDLEYDKECNKAIIRAKDFDINKTIDKFKELSKNANFSLRYLSYKQIFFIVTSMVFHLISKWNTDNYFKRLEIRNEN